MNPEELDVAIDPNVDFLARLGWGLLMAINATRMAGHETPRGTLFYTEPVAEGIPAFVQDFISWCVDDERTDRPGCRDRLYAFLDQHKIGQIAAELAAKRIL